MKKNFSIFTASLLLFATSLFAQSIEKMSYQTNVHDSNNKLVSNSKVKIQISIIQSTADGKTVYVETHTPITNSKGMATVQIGNGSPISGEYSDINLKNNPYYIKTEIDPKGGVNYTITRISQLMSVPYASHAKSADYIKNKFFLGQDTLGGIVFHIYLDNYGKQHGLIVSKTETTAKWQNAKKITNATFSWDGVYNMNLMSNSPAKDWVTGNFSKEWYIPSIDELSLLWQNLYHVNNALKNTGATPIISTSEKYWSSTEYNTGAAVYISGGATNNYDKLYSCRVRAIRAY